MLTDTLSRELSDVGPEDVVPQTQLEELGCSLEEHVIITITCTISLYYIRFKCLNLMNWY